MLIRLAIYKEKLSFTGETLQKRWVLNFNKFTSNLVILLMYNEFREDAPTIDEAAR